MRVGAARGMSLIDVIVTSGLILVVFLGFFGMFQAAVVLVSSGKARAGAVALATERMEFIRSLSYDDVGTAGGIPAGPLVQSEAIVLNQTSYMRRTFIQYVDDAKDGLGASDSNGITADYKVAKVELSWTIKGSPRSYALISSIVPKGIESLTGGGVLTVRALDALGAPVSGAAVRVFNATGTTTIDVTTYTNAQGTITLPGTPANSGYAVTVSKSNYSTAKTYASDEQNPNPNPGHLTVAVGQTTTATFAIDTLASLTLRSWHVAEAGFWSDSFDTAANIATSSGVDVGGGIALLASSSSEYVPTGEFYSVDITPPYIDTWGSFTWSSTTPPGTTLLLRGYYREGPTLILLPESLLPGNAVGFTTAPVSLAAVATSTYPTLALGATLTTADTSITPQVFDWRIDYGGGPTPLPDISFTITGSKTIGTNSSGVSIPKYSATAATDGTSMFATTTLEWDSYNVTFASGGYTVSTTSEPFPFSLSPGQSKNIDVVLQP